ncbi:hypothetical protein [Vreelandella venusta]|uniref:hypothetical protein n=1 Tax=Vreelandella venusta TaxID=44935 RepID=UPI0011705D5F|nr:hypothetical protein [Halomonas venusta]GEK52349.1 hypothetical protein HVE01_30700 [Halomonas venusta]
MGWNPFKSKRKTTVDTAVMRVMEDRDLPETVKQSVIRAVLKQGGDIRNEILDGIINGAALKFDRLYEYAQTHYPLGLPEGTRLKKDDGVGVVKNIIEATEENGQPIEILYYYFGEVNGVHFARKELTEKWRYSQEDNEVKKLSDQKGFPVYVKDIYMSYTSATLQYANGTLGELRGTPGKSGYNPSTPFNSTLGKWVKQTPYEVDDEANSDAVKVVVEWRDDDRVLHESTLTIPLTASVLESGYFQVHYKISGEYKYWTYALSSNLYPAIEQIYDPDYSGTGDFFPFVFFRSHKENMTSEDKRDTELYRQSEKLLSMLGMDYGVLGEQIHENPDIDDVEQAVMWMGVPIVTEEDLENRYLFRFFRKAYFLDPLGSRDAFAFSVKDRDFEVIIKAKSVAYRTRGGVIADKGKTTAEGTAYVETEDYQSRVYYGEGEWEYETKQRPVVFKKMVFRHQTTDSHYEEIEVDHPQISYEIWEGHKVEEDLGDERFLIPIDKGIADTFSAIEKEILYSRSLHLVFNSRITQKVKWYESSFFKGLLVLAAIVISVYSMGTTWEAIVAAYALGGLTAALLVVVTEVATQFVLQEGIKLFVDEVGVDIAFYAALVAAVYSGFKGIQQGSLKGAPWASELMALSSGMSHAIENYMSGLMMDLQQEYVAFQSEAEASLKDLSDARSLLDVNRIIDPYNFIKQEPLIVPGESPDNFYKRTLQSGNIASTTIDMVDKYVEYSLRLPEPHETLGGFI